jgi:hypothetical protein
LFIHFLFDTGHRIGIPRGPPGMLLPPPHGLPLPPSFLPTRAPRFGGPPPGGNPVDYLHQGMPPPSAVPPPQMIPGDLTHHSSGR